MTVHNIIIHALDMSTMMLQRATDDLTSEEMLHRPVPAANCTAWLIGHLILTERSALKRLAVPADALPGLPDGFDKRFSRDEGCPQAIEFGDVSILIPLFLRQRELLVEAVRRATPEQLATPIEPARPMFRTLGELVNFMALHATMHLGQITIIRRSLGRPPMV